MLVSAGSCRFGQRNPNLFLHRLQRDFLVSGNRQTVLDEAFQISFDRLFCTLMSLLVAVAFGYEPRKSRTRNNVTTFLSRFKQHGVAIFRHGLSLSDSNSSADYRPSSLSKNRAMI